MLRSAKGADIAQLWAGEWDELGFSSQSEADLALCNRLAFFTNRDAEQMDRLFRQSGLMRDKWDRSQSGSTYGAMTLQRAIQDCRAEWNPQFRSGQGLTDGVARAVEFLRGVDLAHSREYRRDDLGAGQLLADFLKPLCRPVPERGGWYVYDGRRWKQDLGGAAIAEHTKNLARRCRPMPPRSATMRTGTSCWPGPGCGPRVKAVRLLSGRRPAAGPSV